MVVYELLPDFAGIKAAEAEVVIEEKKEKLNKKDKKEGKVMYFLMPLLVLIFCTILPYPWDFDYWGSGFTFSMDYILAVLMH